LAVLVALAGHPATATGLSVPAAAQDRLDAARDDLLARRFEQALAEIEALLAAPELPSEQRADALALRSEVHVALGDLDAAERDFRELLLLRPDHAPDPQRTPAKARARFLAAQASLVGRLSVRADPPDARIVVDGREVGPLPADGLMVLAGEHEVVAERAGFDALGQLVRVDAGGVAQLELRLVPNARSVLVHTEPEGVDVVLDGTWVGRTVRPAGPEPEGAAAPAAQLRIEDVAPGEHVIELSKPCHRTERIEDVIAVDLLDRSPRDYELVQLRPASATLRLRGGPAGAEVRVDGAAVAVLPADAVSLCPGEHRIEVRSEERIVWASKASLEDAREHVLEVVARPNAVLAGSEWPESLAGLLGQFNVESGLRIAEGADLSRPEGWASASLRPDTDLAFAPAGRASSWYVHSPALGIVERIDLEPAWGLERPSWTGVVWGAHTVDSALGGPALVAEVHPGSPADAAGLRPGDRIVAVGGSPVASSAQVRAVLGVATARSPLRIEWQSSRDGTRREGELHGAVTPRLDLPRRAGQAAVWAAWATVDALHGGGWAPLALANLALLRDACGAREQAAETWRQVSLPERVGLGQGTVRYYLGRALQRLGRDEAAEEALGAAARSPATAVDDEGPQVAPAALDRLADLRLEPGG
jgi:tetratricopeptide (TPR) repeat protein